MAKSKSPRKKKPANARHGARHIVLAIKAAYNKLFFMGSSNCPITAFRTNTLRAHLKPQDVQLAIPTLLDELRYFPRDWHIWVGAFCENGEERWVETAVSKMEQFVVSDFTDNAESIVNGILEGFDLTHMIGYGYMVAPNDYYDMAEMSDELCDKWVEANIYDKSTHLARDLLKLRENDFAAAFMGLSDYVIQTRERIVEKTVANLEAKGLKVTKEQVQEHFNQQEIVDALVPAGRQINPFNGETL